MSAENKLSLRVLIAEDSETLTAILTKMLEDLGHEVVGIFEEGEGVLQGCIDTNPDLVLMDINLSGDINGIETAEILNKNHPTPFMYLTSYYAEEVIQTAKMTNPYAFLIKPVERHVLKTHLEIFGRNHLIKNKEKDITESLIEELTVENNRFKKENELLKIELNELNLTNQNLIAATWREREIKQKLQETLLELKNTKGRVELQHKNIQDSINYAERIQTAMLPDFEVMESAFSEFFAVLRPKDIVSGDFPWIYSKAEYLYFAVADCTGHGVPGALMSVISYLSLKMIMQDDQVLLPSEILLRLHYEIVEVLKQDDNSNDGMDISLCRYSKKTGELVFSGAHQKLLVAHDNEITLYKSSPFPIGGTQYKGKNEYSDRNILIKEGNLLLLFSDGLTDQFGGVKNRKLGIKNLKSFVGEHEHLPLIEFKEKLLLYFQKWQGSLKQIDDVLIMGLRI